MGTEPIKWLILSLKQSGSRLGTQLQQKSAAHPGAGRTETSTAQGFVVTEISALNAATYSILPQHLIDTAQER
ncbi:hypothetical protein EBAPG3_14940 [Nitrosospira lacus]|nr:hypothetical protein EBAPG3_14940 [Nitrosospira lacus]